jgi:hypothetical protein
VNNKQIKQGALALITKALPNRLVQVDRMEDMPGLLTNTTTIQVSKPKNGGVYFVERYIACPECNACHLGDDDMTKAIEQPHDGKDFPSRVIP